MYDEATLHGFATDRMANARRDADLHRLRVALRRDLRSMTATWLQRLALRLDTRAHAASDPQLGVASGAAERLLCRAM